MSKRNVVMGRRGRAITLGQFRKLTEGQPDDMLIKMYDEGRTDQLIDVLSASISHEDPFGQTLRAPVVEVQVS
jgi:hypothetical protein